MQTAVIMLHPWFTVIPFKELPIKFHINLYILYCIQSHICITESSTKEEQIQVKKQVYYKIWQLIEVSVATVYSSSPRRSSLERSQSSHHIQQQEPETYKVPEMRKHNNPLTCD